MNGADGQIQGLGRQPAPPVWPPLTADEVSGVLDGQPGFGRVTAVAWSSPRPLSAAALVRTEGAAGEGLLFVKRHHVRVRDEAALVEEHAFAAHLRSRGIGAPRLLGGPLRRADWVYELWAPAEGTDTYRDALSWTPYTAVGQARSAGMALGHLHRAAAGWRAPARPFRVLSAGTRLGAAADPGGAVAALAAARPGLRTALAGRPWAAEIDGVLGEGAGRRSAALARVAPQWGHGDWHPSNLTWSGAGPEATVVQVLDLGLADRTSAVVDLATAIERTTVEWLDLVDTGRAGVHLDHLDALVDGYRSVRPLSAAEVAALLAVLPAVHADLALSELEYFHDVVGDPDAADLAWDGYLIGHARWWHGPGRDVLDHLAGRLAAQGDGGAGYGVSGWSSRPAPGPAGTG